MSELAVVERPELKTESIAVVDKANSIVIKTNDDNASAIEYVKVIKQAQKKITDELGPNVKKAHALHKDLKAQMDKFLNPLKLAETTIKNKSLAYQQEVARKIRAEEERKAIAAKKKEEEERKKLLEKARKAEESGNTETADMLKQQSEEVHVEVKPVTTVAPKVNGSAMKDNWQAEIVDINKVPESYIIKEANMKALNALAKSTKGKINIPGVRFVNKPTMAVIA